MWIIRTLFNDLFKPDALELYAPIIEEELDFYVANMRSRVEKDDEIDIYLVQELSVFCLNLFAKIFTGKDLSNEQVEDFVAYNKGLLSLSRSSKEWKAAKEALDRLVPEMSRRSENDTYTAEHAAVGDLISAAYEKLMSNYPENERSKRTGTSKTLFIWGAYIECAALMINSLEIVKNLEVSERSEIVNNILNDSEKKDSPNFLARGITRESLRLNPPAGGGFRTSDFDVDIAGYRIPAGTVITADPRIGNLDNNLYPRANEIIPERWIPSTSAESVRESACPFKGTALNQGAGSWFPGGIGGHQCPGVTLAETIASSFLIKFLKNFESWKISSGIDKEGNIKYVLIPIKIPVEDFSVRLTVRK